MSLRALATLVLITAIPLCAQEQAPATVPARNLDRLSPRDLETYPIDQLVRRGYEHHQAGRLPEAMQDWMELARRRPEGGLAFYNLACAYGLMGKPEQAGQFLEAAWKLGFRNLEFADKDADFDRVRLLPAFKEAMVRLKAESKKANSEDLLGRLLQVPARAWHPVRVLVPKSFEIGKAYPLLVALHGAGGSAAGFAPFGQAFAARGFLVCLVEGQYPVRDGLNPSGAIHFLSKPGGGRNPEEDTLRLAEEYVLAAIETVRKQYLVNPKRIFLTGFSQGAMLTYSLGLRHGNRFRGLIPIGGTVIGELPAKATTESSWLVCHSPTDAAITDAEHKKAMDVLGSYGIKAEVQRYEGGHVLPDAVLLQIGTWMKRMVD
jgi:phospholipase/carboxylesterase